MMRMIHFLSIELTFYNSTTTGWYFVIIQE